MVILIVLCAVVSVTALYTYLVAPGRLPRASDATLFKTAYAHRGLHAKDGSVPENSLAAFKAAAAAGYGIELDVHLTADGQVVVFHDDTLKRMCGADKAVCECTYEQLLDHRLLGTEQRIPLLSEVFEAVGGRVPLLVELKNGKQNKALCEKTAALLDGYSGVYCIESFNPLVVAWFKKHRPQVVRGQLACGRGGYHNIPSYQGVLLSMMLMNVFSRPHFAAYSHGDARGRLSLWLVRLLGGKLVGWTVRDTDDIACSQSYFDAIIFEFFRP